MTIDTTGGGAVPTGRSIVITGTVNDDLVPTSFVLLAGTVGTASLQGAVGGTTPVAGLTASANVVRLPAVRTSNADVSVTTQGAGAGPFIVLGGNIDTSQGALNAGNVSLTGPVRLETDVQITTDHSTGADGNVSFVGAGSTINSDPLNPGLRSLTIVAGGGSVSFGGAVGNTQPLQSLTIGAGDVAVHALVTTGSQSITATGDVTVAAGSTSASLNASGAQTITAGGTLTVQGGAGTGLSARIVGDAGQTINASNILVSGGSVGDSSFAEILQTGAAGIQEIEASSITINGGTSGTNNFARIRNDGTGAQTVTVTGPLTLIGGTDGAPDQGNFAQILAVGLQDIEAGNTTLAGGVTGASNFATIESPNQDITVHGDLTLTGRGSVVGEDDPGGARIGGLGGAVLGPTNLTLTVDRDVILTGGNTLNAAAVIGNSFQGGQTTDITMSVGRNLTLNPGTVPNSAARIGSPSAALGGGDIEITVVGDVTLNGTATGNFAGTVIRTADSLTLQANAITIHGGAISAGTQTTPGTQTISAVGDISVVVTGANNAIVSATGLQTITAGGVLTLQGGATGTGRSAQLNSSGGQDITAAGIVLVGGSGDINNFAEIRQTGLEANQAIMVTGGGTLSMQGGLGGVDNFARIRNDGVNQQINFPAGGAIVLTGGNGPDVPPNPLDTANNFARLENRSLTGLQTIQTGTIALNGAITGANNFTGIQAAHQVITTTGNVTLHGGPAGNSGSRIGAVGDTSPTDVTLIVGGSLTLTGGAVGDAVIGANQAGGQTTDIHIEVDGDFVANGGTAGGGVRIGSPEGAVGGGNISIHAGQDGTGNIVFSGRAQLRTLGEVTLTTPGTLSMTGGSTGSGNAALIESDGNQTISANTIALTGGLEGALDLGNFARITSVLGLQTITVGTPITAGAMTLTAGASGINNYASITGPNQVITVHGDLTLTGGGSAASAVTGGGARIGGLGGAVTGPTNLTLTVGGNVTMTGGTVEHAGAVIGSNFLGGQTTNITMSVGDDLTLNPGTVPNSGSRIGSPGAAVAGGDISIVAVGDITLNSSLTPGVAGTVIRTLGGLTLEADTITIGGQVTTGVQTVNASGGLIVQGATPGSTARLTATGGQTINAQFVSVTASGGNALIENLTSGAQLITTTGMNAAGEGLAVRSLTPGTFARIAEDVEGGVQVINVSNADRLTVDGVNGVPVPDGPSGIAAEIRNITGTQTITVTGTGDNAIMVGSAGALAGSNINALTQSITAGVGDESGSISVIGPAANSRLAGILTNSLGGMGSGTQTIFTTGTISVTGGSAPIQAGNFNSGIFHNQHGLQSITATDIVIQGGTAGTGNGAFVNSGPNGGDQLITVSGSITLNGGSGAGTSNNRAGMNAQNANQTITGNPDIVVSGGASGGAVGAANTATMQTGAGKLQVINAASIIVSAGTGGTDNSGILAGGTQLITVVGNVTVNGGSSNAGAAGIGRIGGPGGLPTDLTLNVGGNLTLNGGSELPAAIGSNRVGGQPTDITINVDGSVILNAGSSPAGNPRIGSPETAIAGGDIEIHAGLDGVGDIVFNGGSQIRTLGKVTLTTPGTLSMTGGSTGSGNAALIESNGNQTISANTIALSGGLEGALDLGNFARITSVLGLQTITAGSLTTPGAMTLTAGASGFNNYASITGPNQAITVHGDLTLTGGGSAASLVTGGGARIGGLGGAVTGPTNLDLTVRTVGAVGGNVTMNGGTEVFAGAVIGSSFTGGQTTDITMLVGGSLTMNPGTVPNSGARIGSPSTNPAGGDISITVGGNITMGGSLAVGALGTVIRTIGGEVTLDAGAAITIAGSVFSGAQTVSAGGNITVAAAGLSGAVMSATGLQTITAGGALTVEGGAGTGLTARITSSGGQDIAAAGIGIVGGSGGTNNFAEIRQTGGGADQAITVTGGGSITLQGGLSGADNFARIRNDGVNQQIDFPVGGAIVLTGGNGPDVAPEPLDTANNFARIENRSLTGLQTIDTGTITLNGAITGANNFTGIQAAHQVITTTGNVTLQGGPAENSGSRIGAVGDTSPTDVTLTVGGSLTLTGGAVGDAAIGANRAGGQATDIVITAGGNVTLNPGTSPGGEARIGSPAANIAGGNITITSTGGGIALNSAPGISTGIRTLGNVTLQASGITQGTDAVVQADQLTTSTTTGTSLVGANQVAVFNATNTSTGNVTFVDGGGLTVTGISNPVGDISVSTTGQMTVTGSLDSGTHDMSLTAPSGVFFTASAVVNVDLAGTDSTEFTNITILGAAALDGTLDADLVNGFMPTAGDRFQFMTFDSRSGFFSTTILPPDFFVDQADPTDLELVFAPPSIAINDVSVVESNSGTAAALFNVSLSRSSSQTVMVNFSTADGTAQAGSLDYQPVSGTLTFAPGETSKQITVDVNGDFIVEADETFFVNLSGSTNAVISDGQGIGTIINDDAATLTVDDVSVTEGTGAGTTTLNFTVTSSAAVEGGFDVDFSSLLGTAEADDLSILTTSPLHFAGTAGEAQTIAVNISRDAVVEDHETFTVTLGNVLGTTAVQDAAITTGDSATGTINNDDTAVYTVNDVAVNEADGTLTFTVSVSNPVDIPVAIDVSYADQSATGAAGGVGADYDNSQDQVVFAALDTADKTVTVAITDDSIVEVTETFLASLSTSTALGGRSINTSDQGIGTILDNDAPAGGIDLIVERVEWDPDDLLTPGDHEHVTVKVTNIGDTAVLDQVTVKLYASVDDVFVASDDVFLDESHTGSDIQPGGSKSAQFNLRFSGTLLSGEYFLLAVVDPDNEIAESNEGNNTAIGESFDFESFDFHRMFGNVPGHGRETLTVREADGTWVNFSLIGPGTGEITIDEEGKWDLVVTGTSGSSILSILTLGGGDHRVELDDIHVTGALRGILAPRMDLTGTLAVDGTLGAGMMIGSATDAVIAVQTILGTRLHGLGVQGIAILGDLENSEILIGADLGADGQLGGSGADADIYSAGDLGDLLITGSMISSCVRVGQDPGVDGIFDNSDDVLLDGSIDSITIRGEMTGDSGFVADDLPLFARIDGERVATATDPRFVDSLPSFDSESAGGIECSIDWTANAGTSWGVGYSPFGSRAGQSNFSDYVLRLFG